MAGAVSALSSGATMRVVLNSGRRIGEVVEIDYPTAKIMIADGRATDPRTSIGLSVGGELPATTTFLVGESSPGGSFLPRAVADKFVEAAKKKGGRRSE